MGLCDLRDHEAWQTDWTYPHENDFVTYQTFSPDLTRNRMYLEHCPSGQVLRAEFRPDASDPQGIYFLDRVMGSAPVTQSQLASEMQERGAKTRITKNRTESCACKEHYPETRGTKRPYAAE